MAALLLLAPRIQLMHGRTVCRQASNPVCKVTDAQPRRIRPPWTVMKAASDATAATQSSAQESTFRLRQPVGLVFAQKPSGGPVYVDEVVAGGEADKTGAIRVGDILTKCSAVVLKEGKQGIFEEEGYGERTYENWERVEFKTEGHDFKTVMAALKSNSARWGYNDVQLTFQRPSSS